MFRLRRWLLLHVKQYKTVVEELLSSENVAILPTFCWSMICRGGSRTTATSKMECFVIIVNGFQPLTVITKRSILDVAAVLDQPLIWWWNSYVPTDLPSANKLVSKNQWANESYSRSSFTKSIQKEGWYYTFVPSLGLGLGLRLSFTRISSWWIMGRRGGSKMQ